MMENHLISLVLIFVIHYFDPSEECSCIQGHLQNVFCDENRFVIKVNVLNSVVIPNAQSPGNGKREITVHILKDYKNNVPGVQITLNTAEAEATCGVTLTDGQCYVLGGQIQQGTPDTYAINLCNFIMSCDQLTDFQNNALQTGRYRKACKHGCDVFFDFTGQLPEGVNGCVYNLTNPDCFRNYGICTASCRGKTCSWEFDPDHNCLNS